MKKLYILIFLLPFIATTVLTAQENKTVILNLKTGYSVKGVIVEKTDQFVKIKTQSGEIFEYKTDEINTTQDTKSSSSKLKSTSLPATFPKVVKTGDVLLNVSIGFGGLVPYESTNKLSVPPIPVSIEYIFMDNLFNGTGALGGGIFIGYSSSKQPDSFAYEKIIDSRLIIGARGYIHYGFANKLDTYAGMLLGFKSDKTKFSESTSTAFHESNISEGSAALNLFVGCRYFVSSNLAISGELGWGVSILNLGVSLKF
jgi:hypothetical protein